ncbi:MAG: sensor domain-containing protein [Mycobacterium sp.]
MRYLTAAFAAAGICVLIAGCGSGTTHGTKTTTTTTTTTTKAAPPLMQGSLKGLILSPEQINTVMGATDMSVTRKHDALSDDSATMRPRECLAIDGAAQAQIYAGSNFTDVLDEALQEGDNFTHYAEQALVLFPSAKQADAFFTNSAKQWPACHQYTHIQSGSEWTAGRVSNTNGVLSVTATQQNANKGGWACGRALAVRNNVIVDINTCSADPANTAVVIANQIAAKVSAQ